MISVAGIDLPIVGSLIWGAMDLRRKTAMTNVVPLQSGPGTGSVLSISVEGMTCASCVSHVEKAIAKLPDVAKVSVNLATERADVAFAGKPDAAAVVRAVEGAGYGVPEMTVELGVEGMTCASCVAHVEKAVKAVPGVNAATVNLATERVSVRFFAGVASIEDLEAGIRNAGYEPHRIGGDDAAIDREREARERELTGLR